MFRSLVQADISFTVEEGEDRKLSFFSFFFFFFVFPFIFLFFY